jgi:hypothetical protein
MNEINFKQTRARYPLKLFSKMRTEVGFVIKLILIVRIHGKLHASQIKK